MKILAIETSCDETALALLQASGGLTNPTFAPIKNIVASQTEIHKAFGGVVPNLAKREHIRTLPLLYKEIEKELPDMVAVTVGPGLEPALWAGITFAETVHAELVKKKRSVKLVGANHLEGHLWSFLLDKKISLAKTFPAVALIVSGGHTILLSMTSLTSWKLLGETKDDAVGEAFDKVARMLKFPYPGGPEIQKAAAGGNPSIPFPRPMLGTRDYYFSFSGLKTSVLYYLRDHPRAKKADVAASFQTAALDVLVKKTLRAAEETKAKTVILSGGVAANKALRERLKTETDARGMRFLAPPMDFNTDNAMMIAAAAYLRHLRKKPLPLTADGNLSI
jgi:N6-L-threonylcarbamoyladenine synthase